MKIIFFGSDDFANEHLKKLLGGGEEVVACVAPPDKAKGRGMKLLSSPVKETASKHKIPVLQPEKIGETGFMKQLKDLNPDLFIVIAYGKILPQKILDIPHRGAFNVHASLLPSYRGAAPINWAMIRGETVTGITVIKMSARLDAGDILLQEKIPIHPEDHAVTLRQRMMTFGPDVLLKSLKLLKEGKHKLTRQNEDKVTYAPKLEKGMGRINWEDAAEHIHNLVRGLKPWPSAYSFYQGKQLKILETAVVNLTSSTYNSGYILEIDKKGFVVAAGENALLVKRVHFESAKPMEAYAFVIGHRVEKGQRLG